MKPLITILLLVSINLTAQNKYITKTGIINFEASVPSFEEVSAQNESVTAIINAETGEIAALALVKAFRFKNALMEEHFNENYAESDTFPKTTFKGNILNFDIEKIDSEYFINGTLTYHGVSKQINKVTVKTSVIDNKIVLTGQFSVKSSDFDIKIPKIIQNKITEDIKISFLFELIKK